MIDAAQAMAIIAAADLIHAADTVAAAVNRVAREISEKLRDSHPVLLCAMRGGVPFAGQLMTHLTFPLDFDYVHVGRYGDATRGGSMTWRAEPSIAVGGRTILVVDDILDEGLTLAAIRERMWQLGADACYTAVVADNRRASSSGPAGGFDSGKRPPRRSCSTVTASAPSEIVVF